MSKTSLEKQIEKQMRQEKELERKRAEQARKTANREQAATIISSQKIVDGFKIMNKTSEEILQCLLNCEIKENNLYGSVNKSV